MRTTSLETGVDYLTINV